MFDEEPGKEREEPRPKGRPKNFFFLLVLLFVLILFFFYGRAWTGTDATLKADITRYFAFKAEGKIAEVWVRDGTLEAEFVVGHREPVGDQIRQFKRLQVELPPWYLTSNAGVKLEEGIPPGKFHFERPSIWLPLLAQAIPWLILILLAWWFIIRQIRSSGGPGNVLAFGRSRAKFVTQDKIRTTFEDVAGIDEAKEDVKEIVEFLKDPQKFQRLGGRIPRGVLLVGPPGTGKTLLAKAIAGEAAVRLLSITGSDFVEMFVGVGAARVRDLFNTAKEKSPCIVFIDEIDAVGRRRGTGLGGGHDEREQTLNQILVEMDGFDTDEGVIVIAATNRPDVLDPALLRPGRFDRQVYIDLPDVKGREDILKVHAKKIRLGPDADLRELAQSTPMLSGADLANIINEAAIIGTLKRAEAVSIADLMEARDKVIFGRQKKSRVIDEHERKITATHEAGHTLVSAKLLSHVLPLHKVTIIPRGRALGMTMAFPDKDRYHLPKDQCLRQLAMMFGGRAAEELIFGEISAGAADDIKKATELARRMICEWGMSDKLGPVNYTEAEEHFFLGREIAKTRNISEETQKAIDAEMKGILDTAHREAVEILTEHRAPLERLGAALLKYETLTGPEVMKILAGESIDEMKERERAEREAEEAARRAAESRPRGGEPGWKPKPLAGPQQA